MDFDLTLHTLRECLSTAGEQHIRTQFQHFFDSLDQIPPTPEAKRVRLEALSLLRKYQYSRPAPQPVQLQAVPAAALLESVAFSADLLLCARPCRIFFIGKPDLCAVAAPHTLLQGLFALLRTAVCRGAPYILLQAAEHGARTLLQISGTDATEAVQPCNVGETPGTPLWFARQTAFQSKGALFTSVHKGYFTYTLALPAAAPRSAPCAPDCTDWLTDPLSPLFVALEDLAVLP